MPGNMRTFRVGTGYADVPEENVDKWLQRMQSRGVSVSVPEVSAEMSVGEPEAIHSSHGASGEWGDDQDMDFMDSFVNGAKETASDAVRGLNSGLYMGGSDEMEGSLNAMAGRGSLVDTVTNARQQNAQAEQRSPWAYNMSKTAGYIPGMLVGPASAAGRALMSAGQGAATGLLSSDSDDLGEMASDTLAGANIGLGGGMLGEGVAAGARALRGGADDAGVALRRMNAGGTQGELNAIRQNQGIDQMQTGINDDFRQLGLADTAWKSFKPQSAGDVYRRLGSEKNANGILGNEGQRMGGSIDAAGEGGARGDWDSVRQLMQNADRRNMSAAPMPTQSMQAQSGALGRIAENELPPHIAGPAYDAELPGNPEFNPNEATPRALQQQKVAFGKDAYPPSDGPVSLISDAPGQRAYQDAYGAARGELGDVMENAGPSISSLGDNVAAQRPNQNFLGGAQSVQQATPLAQMAGKRASANEAGSSMNNFLTYGPAAAGAGLGGAAAGVPGAIAGAAVGGGLNTLARNYGQDVAGIGMRNIVSPAMGGIGNAAQYGGMMAGPGGGSMQGGGMPPPPMPAGPMGDQQQTDNSNGLPAGTRGYLVPEAAQQALQQNPMFFGKFTQQFKQAQQSQDENELARLIDRLDTTDPEFAPYADQLRAMTAQSGGNF